MNNYKRFMILLITSMMAMCIASPVQAQQQSAQYLLLDKGRHGLLQTGQMSVIGSNLYIKSQEGIYTWHPGELAANRIGDRLWIEGPTARDVFMAACGEKTYAIDSQTQIIYLLEESEKGLTSSTSWAFPSLSDDHQELPPYGIQGAAWADGKLWLLVFAVDSGENELWNFSLGESALARQNAYDILAITGFDEERLIVVQEDQDAAVMASIWEAKGNTKEKAMTLDGANVFVPALSIFYQRQGERMFYSTQQSVVSVDMDGQNIEKYDVLGKPYSIAVIENRYMAALSESGLSIVDIQEPLAQKAAIRIAGSIPDEVLHYAQALMPHVAIEVLSEWDEKLTQEAMISRSPDVDLYVMSTDRDRIDTIIEKGYILPLPQGSGAEQFLSGSYSFIRESLARGDKAYLLPVSLRTQLFAYRPEVFQEIGIDAPTSFDSYIQALKSWMNGVWQEYPEYSFGQMEDLRREVLLLAYDIYRDSKRLHGEDLSFDDPRFREMMAQIAKMDQSKLYKLGAPSEEDRDTYGGFSILPMTDYADYRPEQEHERHSLMYPWEPIVMALDENTEQAAQANLTVIGVSAFSQNVDLAFEFLEKCRIALPETFVAMIQPGKNDPIINPGYAMEVERYQSVIDVLKADIEKVRSQGGNPSGYEQDLSYFQSLLDQSERTIKYILTTEEAELVHQKIEKLYIPNDQQRMEDQSEIDDLFDQFIDGALPLDHFIDQAESILRKIRAENR